MSRIDVAELRRLVAGIEIEELRLLEAECTNRIHPSQVKPSEVSIEPAAKLASGMSDDGTFVVLARLIAHVRPSEGTGADTEPTMTFRVIYEVKYRAPLGEKFKDETLQEFIRRSAIFHCWPYWREFVHTSTARMGMPAILLPMFRMGELRTATNAQSLQEKPVSRPDSAEVVGVSSTVKKQAPTKRRRKR